MRIVWTKRALSHIESIGAFLEERNPAAATRLLNAIRSSVESLLSTRSARASGDLHGHVSSSSAGHLTW